MLAMSCGAQRGQLIALLDNPVFIEVVGVNALHVIRGRCVHPDAKINHQLRQPAAVDETTFGSMCST